MPKSKRFLFFIVAAVTSLLLTACGGGDEEEMTLVNENWEEVTVTESGKPTVFLHFTGVG
ncbi:hypothetical protein [Alteribacillus iranensis]|uniref:Uncharacterized protein n=1 Tax=Alteribacillus iranensis TaxID=930128 RepID=A0A1I2CX45_9BACI|nr:hypothetical protein [Alteribacillus iranensis]SFE72854.1 hypothetical protein SAMN05192532_103261 [Alteribacillus iranensis]